MISEILLLLTSFPTGLLLARLTREELKDGKKYFKVLFYASLVIGIAFLAFSNVYGGLSMLYLSVVAGISYLNPEKLK